MKYLLIIALLVAVLVTAGCVSENNNTVSPATGKVTVYFFYGEECPHCHTVMPFIQNLSKKYPDVNFRILETWHNTTNADIFSKMNDQLKVPTSNRGVPEVIVVGNTTPLIGSRDIPAYLEGVIIEQLKKSSN
jgi:thiol-disulfide isomerase/thioredoxin